MLKPSCYDVRLQLVHGEPVRRTEVSKDIQQLLKQLRAISQECNIIRVQ